MAAPNDETPAETPKFDFSAYPPNTLFYDRRTGLERRKARPPEPEPEPASETRGVAPAPRVRRDRRRRIDPTTFEKQYTDDEIEFMTAMQNFKVQSGKTFPTYGDALVVAAKLGYRRLVVDEADDSRESEADPTCVSLVPA